MIDPDAPLTEEQKTEFSVQVRRIDMILREMEATKRPIPYRQLLISALGGGDHPTLASVKFAGDFMQAYTAWLEDEAGVLRRNES